MIKEFTTHLAFLGPQGSYSHAAATQYAHNRHFNKIKEYSCKKFQDIFTLVELNYAEYGIVPIENSNAGVINEVCRLLLNTKLLLVDEIIIPIRHHILVKKCSNINNIQTIYSHPQPIQQCSKFLTNFSACKIIRCESSAAAMKTVAKLNKSNLAALGSAQGGIFYGLRALSTHDLSNYQKNRTRFFILKNINTAIINNSKPVKTTLIASFDQKSKKLCEIFKILQFYNIKITYLKPRLLLHNTLNNIIIIEIMAHVHNMYIRQILTELRKISHTLKILGCYSITPNTYTNNLYYYFK